MKFQYVYENPFDIAARGICHLRRLDEERFNDRDFRNAVMPPDDLDHEVDLLFQELPYISDIKRLLRCGVPPEELSMVRKWSHYNDFPYMLQFLSRYTQKLQCKEVFSSNYFGDITHAEDGQAQEFESLNSNVEETGLLILPQVQTINDPLNPAEEGESLESEQEQPDPSGEKHWATDRIPGIQSDLPNILYVEKKELLYGGKSYHVLHSVFSRDAFPENKQTLRIAVCPVACRDFLNVETYSKPISAEISKKFCSVSGLKDEIFAYNRIQAAFMKAGMEHADILIFPEMLGNKEVLSQAFFDEIRKNLKALKYPMPWLTLMPTWWHEYRNELYVLDSSGKCLCIQQKQKPYLFRNKYEEDLRDPEPVIHMVHIPGVGRFAFPICRDLLEDDYIRIMLRQLRTTFLLCPSYSPHKTQFDFTAVDGIKYGCYTVWCNTCAAYYDKGQPPSHIGLVAGPQTPPETIKLLSPECGGKCGNENTACIFIIDIEMDRSANISYKHIIEEIGA